MVAERILHLSTDDFATRWIKRGNDVLMGEKCIDGTLDADWPARKEKKVAISPFPALGCRGTSHYLALFPHAYSVPGDGASHFL